MPLFLLSLYQEGDTGRFLAECIFQVTGQEAASNLSIYNAASTCPKSPRTETDQQFLETLAALEVLIFHDVLVATAANPA